MREDACPRSYPKSIFPPQASLKQLSYLLDVHTFSPEDVSLNQTTLTWPSKLNPIFEDSEQVCEGGGGGERGGGEGGGRVDYVGYRDAILSRGPGKPHQCSTWLPFWCGVVFHSSSDSTNESCPRPAHTVQTHTTIHVHTHAYMCIYE